MFFLMEAFFVFNPLVNGMVKNCSIIYFTVTFRILSELDRCGVEGMGDRHRHMVFLRHTNLLPMTSPTLWKVTLSYHRTVSPLVVVRLQSVLGTSVLNLFGIRLYLTGRVDNLGLKVVRGGGSDFKKSQDLLELSGRSGVSDVKDPCKTMTRPEFLSVEPHVNSIILWSMSTVLSRSQMGGGWCLSRRVSIPCLW